MIWSAKRSYVGVLIAVMAALSTGCSDDKDVPQEVVAPAAEKTPYPEDQDLALGDKKEAAPPPAADPSTPSDGAVVKDLTTDQAPPTTEQPAADGSTAARPAEPPVEDGDTVGAAFAQNTPNYEPAPSTLPPEDSAQQSATNGVKREGNHHAVGAHHGKPGKHGKHAKKPTPSGTSVRYVNAKLLNVRSSPNRKAKSVRQLSSGSEVTVELHGKWAKIKKGEWIRTKYLSTTPVQ